MIQLEVDEVRACDDAKEISSPLKTDQDRLPNRAGDTSRGHIRYLARHPLLKWRWVEPELKIPDALLKQEAD